MATIKDATESTPVIPPDDGLSGHVGALPPRLGEYKGKFYYAITTPTLHVDTMPDTQEGANEQECERQALTMGWHPSAKAKRDRVEKLNEKDSVVVYACKVVPNQGEAAELELPR